MSETVLFWQNLIIKEIHQYEFINCPNKYNLIISKKSYFHDFLYFPEVLLLTFHQF